MINEEKNSKYNIGDADADIVLAAFGACRGLGRAAFEKLRAGCKC